MQQFFIIDEDFNKIIDRALKENMGVTYVKSIKPISTGWTNIVYKVHADNGNYYLRFPRDQFWERTIVKDYQFAKYIKGKTSFNTVELVLAYDEERPFSIHKEIPGTPLAEKMQDLGEEDIKKISKQIAKFMHELHNIKFNKAEMFSINNIGLDLNDFISELLSEHVSIDDQQFWKENNFTNKEKTCLVHGDLNSSNVLLDNNNDVTAIIDFGFGGFGNKYFDVSRIIGRCTEEFKAEIVKNYEMYDNERIDIEELDKNIKIWSNIDQGYINYMKKIGIYS